MLTRSIVADFSAPAGGRELAICKQGDDDDDDDDDDKDRGHKRNPFGSKKGK